MPKNKKKLPGSEFTLFSTALSLLVSLSNDGSEYLPVQERLAQLVGTMEGNRSDEAEKKVSQFIEKFRRNSLKRYGEEAFDLRVISQSLKGEAEQKNYLLHRHKFTYTNPRQLINIVTKVINHFQLAELAKLFRKKYFSEVDLIEVTRYLDPRVSKG